MSDQGIGTPPSAECRERSTAELLDDTELESMSPGFFSRRAKSVLNDSLFMDADADADSKIGAPRSGKRRKRTSRRTKSAMVERSRLEEGSMMMDRMGSVESFCRKLEKSVFAVRGHFLKEMARVGDRCDTLGMTVQSLERRMMKERAAAEKSRALLSASLEDLLARVKKLERHDKLVLAEDSMVSQLSPHMSTSMDGGSHSRHPIRIPTDRQLPPPADAQPQVGGDKVMVPGFPVRDSHGLRRMAGRGTVTTTTEEAKLPEKRSISVVVSKGLSHVLVNRPRAGGESAQPTGPAGSDRAVDDDGTTGGSTGDWMRNSGMVKRADVLHMQESYERMGQLYEGLVDKQIGTLVGHVRSYQSEVSRDLTRQARVAAQQHSALRSEMQRLNVEMSQFRKAVRGDVEKVRASLYKLEVDVRDQRNAFTVYRDHSEDSMSTLSRHIEQKLLKAVDDRMVNSGAVAPGSGPLEQSWAWVGASRTQNDGNDGLTRVHSDGFPVRTGSRASRPSTATPASGGGRAPSGRPQSSGAYSVVRPAVGLVDGAHAGVLAGFTDDQLKNALELGRRLDDVESAVETLSRSSKTQFQVLNKALSVHENYMRVNLGDWAVKVRANLNIWGKRLSRSLHQQLRESISSAQALGKNLALDIESEAPLVGSGRPQTAVADMRAFAKGRDHMRSHTSHAARPHAARNATAAPANAEAEAALWQHGDPVTADPAFQPAVPGEGDDEPAGAEGQVASMLPPVSGQEERDGYGEEMTPLSPSSGTEPPADTVQPAERGPGPGAEPSTVAEGQTDPRVQSGDGSLPAADNSTGQSAPHNVQASDYVLCTQCSSSMHVATASGQARLVTDPEEYQRRVASGLSVYEFTKPNPMCPKCVRTLTGEQAAMMRFKPSSPPPRPSSQQSPRRVAANTQATRFHPLSKTAPHVRRAAAMRKRARARAGLPIGVGTRGRTGKRVPSARNTRAKSGSRQRPRSRGRGIDFAGPPILNSRSAWTDPSAWSGLRVSPTASAVRFRPDMRFAQGAAQQRSTIGAAMARRRPPMGGTAVGALPAIQDADPDRTPARTLSPAPEPAQAAKQPETDGAVVDVVARAGQPSQGPTHSPTEGHVPGDAVVLPGAKASGLDSAGRNDERSDAESNLQDAVEPLSGAAGAFLPGPQASDPTAPPPEEQEQAAGSQGARKDSPAGGGEAPAGLQLRMSGDLRDSLGARASVESAGSSGGEGLSGLLQHRTTPANVEIDIDGASTHFTPTRRFDAFRSLGQSSSDRGSGDLIGVRESLDRQRAPVVLARADATAGSSRSRVMQRRGGGEDVNVSARLPLGGNVHKVPDPVGKRESGFMRRRQNLMRRLYDAENSAK